MAHLNGACFKCGRMLGTHDYGRGETCPDCREDTRCCRNCGYYSPSYNNECKEPAADTVAKKESSNFCEFFKPTAHAEGRVPSKGDEEKKDAFARLFKKKEG